MNRYIYVALLVVSCALVFQIKNVFGSENPCTKLVDPVSGSEKKYSIAADVNGFAAFADIACGIKWRKGDLCAMEIVSFDTTAQVVAYYSNKELVAASAFYVVEAPGEKHVVAFESAESAAKFIAEKGSGKKLDYDGLNEYVE